MENEVYHFNFKKNVGIRFHNWYNNICLMRETEIDKYIGDIDMNILLALVPAIMWGSIGLVSGRLGGSASQQTLGMTMGAVIFSLVTLVIYQPTLTLRFGLLV